MVDSLTPALSVSLRLVPALVLLWLAFFFGRTLRAGAVPLIERVARIGKPALSNALCRYTRRLTALWCGFFIAAAIVAVAMQLRFQQSSLGVGASAAAFFVGEYWLRQRLFPDETFPGFVQQIRDTVQIWRPRRSA